MHKVKKISLFIISALLIVLILVVAFVSPITKYLVEKYDEQYTGRQIKMDWAYVNPFTGYVHLHNLKIHEFKSDSVFFSVVGLSADLAIHKLLNKTYQIEDITLNHPKGTFIQQKKELNIDDLINKFSGSKNDDTVSTKPSVHFNIVNVKIIEGEFHYREKQIHINYFIKNVNIESSGKVWDSDTVGAKFSFVSGIGNGDAKGSFSINLQTLEYNLSTLIHHYDLNLIEQYLKDISNYGSLKASFDADVKASGNFNDQENINASGQLVVNDFHFGKNISEDYASFDKLVLAINELSPKKHLYLCDSIMLKHPYFKYERYDKLDNLQTMFGAGGSKIANSNNNQSQFNLIIEIANYIKVLSKNFFKSDYKINKVAVYEGDLKFNDYSQSEKFALDLNPFYVFADSIDKNHKRVEVAFKSGIKPYGNTSVHLSINPKDSSDFDLQYIFEKIPLTAFNPYSITYTSYPLDRGTLGFNGNWHVQNGIIKSINHLVLIDPRLHKRIKNKNHKWLPMPLLFYLIRERGNVIDYEIPITGDLKNPKFHLHDVLWDVFENIFVKPITTPYSIVVRNTETEIEKSLTLKWSLKSASILPNQEKFINRMADFLSKNPEAKINVYPHQYTIKEKEYLLLYEAKKMFYLESKNKKTLAYTTDDSMVVEKISIKNSLLDQYLNSKIKDALVFTTQEKCSLLLDSAIISTKLKKLSQDRKTAFMAYFIKETQKNQINMATPENIIPYNGFSYYKIVYKGDFPQKLLNAYEQMNELNEKAPRKKFKKRRQETKNKF